jgi:hypothetical protein
VGKELAEEAVGVLDGVMVDVLVLLSAGEDGSEEELFKSASAAVFLNIGGPVAVVGSNLDRENLPIAPRMASTTPVMPTVQMMMVAHFLGEMALYHGVSRGSTQTSSCMTGSLLPTVSGRWEEGASCSAVLVSRAPSPPPTVTGDVEAVPPWVVLGAQEKTTSGYGFCNASAY